MKKRSAEFREWRRDRPFAGALLLMIAGFETFLSTQLDLGNMHIQLGVTGFQATIIPIGFVLLGALIMTMPQHRIFYGVIGLALSIYSIIGVNLGGFLIGMLLSAVGGILAVSWAPAVSTPSAQSVSGAAADEGAVPVAAVPVAAASAHDGVVHAEFVPYTALVTSSGTHADDTTSAPPPFSRAPKAAVRGSAPRKSAPRESSPASGTRPGTAAAALLLFVAALTGVGAAEAPAVQAAALANRAPAPVAAARAAEPGALCVPILMTCPPPTPTPSPSPSTGGGLLGGLLGAVKVPGASGAAPLVIGPDDSAYPMTLPAGQLGGSSISISGIHQLGLVTVKRVDGSSFAVIKLKADDVVITGFLLDVRRATGPALVSSADRMELKGNVSVWLDSLTGSTLGGLGLTLGTDQTPPPSTELPPKLLRVNLGLVATSANSISYVNLHQELHG
ncbi:MAG: DUF6114 domain-containing protein [Pseudolysinimonas sp.]